MSDNLRRYRALRAALIHGYPRQPTGTIARHVPPLAALLSGLGGRPSTPRPNMAAHVPDGPQPERRGKRFARWRRNDPSTADGSFVPCAEVLLTPLALQTLGLVMAGRVVGRGGVALRRPVVSHGRALPGAWRVRQGKQGHVPAALPSALVAQGQARLPAGARGGWLGNGAFAGTRLPHTRPASRWSSVGRTGRHSPVVWDGERLRGETVGACLPPGPRVA